MLSTDERVEFMVWCTVLFLEHLDCNKRLQNKRERGRRFRDLETSHHHDTSSSSITHHILCFNALHIRYQTTKTHQIEITYVAKRRVWLTTTAIHHRYRLMHHHHYGNKLVPRVLYFSPNGGRAGFILSTGFNIFLITSI